MKTIYVLKDWLGFKAITEEKAKEGMESRTLGGVSMIMERPGSEDLEIYVLTRIFFGGIPDTMADQLQQEYFDYVESITGMHTSPKEES